MYCWKDSASADASPEMLTSGPVPESVEPLLLPELELVPLEDAPELLPLLPELDPDVAPLPLPLDPADDDEPPLVPDEDGDPDDDEDEEDDDEDDEDDELEPPESSPKGSTPPAFWLLHPTVTASDRKANDPTNRFAKAIRMTSSTRQVPARCARQASDATRNVRFRSSCRRSVRSQRERTRPSPRLVDA